MGRKLHCVLCTALAASLGACTGSGPSCTTESQSAWMSQADMKSQIAKQGYKIKEFKISGTCYEIYGWDREGRKVEVYFNPVNGEIFKSEVE